MPDETLPARGFSAEYFPQFDGTRQHRDSVTCHPPPRKNPDAAACVGKPGKRCRQFAFGLPQRCRKPLEVASMIYKCLSLMEIRSKNPVCCLGFAAAFGRSA
jgi:hypothetical protein